MTLSYCAFHLSSDEYSAEIRLTRKLLGNYANIKGKGRPVKSITTATPVYFGLGVIQLNIDEKYNYMSISAWTRYVSIY